jgi:monothiol glutaredoxin
VIYSGNYFRIKSTIQHSRRLIVATTGALTKEVEETMNVQDVIKNQVEKHRVVLYMKGTPDFPQCGFSANAVGILRACGVDDPFTVNVLEEPEIRQGIKQFANWPTIPQLYVNGEFIGGSDIMTEMYQSGELKKLLTRTTV